MQIESDSEKGRWTLKVRGLDMARTLEVLAGPIVTEEDRRSAYGDVRHRTVGVLEGRMVVLVWARRGESLRAIGLRKANAREQAAYGPRLRP